VIDSPTLRRPDDAVHPWEGPVLSTALALGLVLMAVQLWLLTVALDLLLGGGPGGILGLALASGAVFAGGLLVLKLLRARPPVSR
jgi:hypothetical protein